MSDYWSEISCEGFWQGIAHTIYNFQPNLGKKGGKIGYSVDEMQNVAAEQRATVAVAQKYLICLIFMHCSEGTFDISKGQCLRMLAQQLTNL